MISAPRARWRKSGVPPTAAHARTGLFTPPGMTRHASAKSRSESCATLRNPDTRPGQGQAEKTRRCTTFLLRRAPHIAYTTSLPAHAFFGEYPTCGVRACGRPAFAGVEVGVCEAGR